MKNRLLYSAMIVLLFGCKKEIGPQFTETQSPSEGSVLVLNEGNFGFGNASVSVYNPETKEVANNQYRSLNGVGMGDVLQSVNRYQDKFYFVVNNSGKVVITDTNLNYINEINGFNSPRYIEFVGNTGFVTDLKQNAVYAVDLTTHTITSEIKTEGWTETILLANSKLLVLDRGDYLSNATPNFIYIINPVTLQKEDSIATGISPNSMVLDNNNTLWVLTSGKTGTQDPELNQYDLTTKLSLNKKVFTSSTDSPSRLVINKEKDKLYFLNNSVYTLPVASATLNPSLFFTKTTENFYGLNVNQQSGDVYVCDAKNYNQTGDVIRLSTSGLVLDKFAAGIIPQGTN